MESLKKTGTFFPIYQIWHDLMMSSIYNRLKPYHITIYNALLYLCNQNYGCTLIEVSQDRLMGLSRVLCDKTYYKAIKELEEYFHLIARIPGKNGYVIATYELLFSGPIAEMVESYQNNKAGRTAGIINKVKEKTKKENFTPQNNTTIEYRSRKRPGRNNLD